MPQESTSPRALAKRIYRAARVVTCDPDRSSVDNPLGVIVDGAVVCQGDTIVFVGASGDAPRDGAVAVFDFGAGVITPGLVDAHTHACWVGSRHDEYVVRLAGGDYRAIAEAGGGIVSSQRAVALATQEELEAALAARLRRMASLGVTCVEVKSGYGLEPQHERKQLRAIAAVARLADVPAVVPTFLALHALPGALRGAAPGAPERQAYVRHVAESLVPEMAMAGLARFVDAYLDQNAFTIEEGRAVATAARAVGLGVRLHIGQFADIGGAELAADVGAASVDHIEHVSADGVARLASAHVTAVLLPIASFTLGDAPPKVADLRRAGVAMAVASDANPGTAPTESLPLAMAFAVRAYGLTPAETWRGVTDVPARSLGETRRGVLRAGAAADFVAWDLPHEAAVLQPWGTSKAALVVRDGVVIARGVGGEVFATPDTDLLSAP